MKILYESGEIITIPHSSIARTISKHWFFALLNFIALFCVAEYPEVLQLDFDRLSETAPKMPLVLLLLAVFDAIFVCFVMVRIYRRRQPFLVIDNCRVVINSLASSKLSVTLPVDEIEKICFGQVSLDFKGITTRKSALGLERKSSNNPKLTSIEEYNLKNYGFHFIIFDEDLEFDAKHLAHIIAERAGLPISAFPEISS